MSDTDPLHAGRPAPLLPEAGAAGTPLTVVIAVLAFMASVALLGFFMVSRAAADWTGDLAGTVTIQVKGANARTIDQGADAAMAVLRETEGVSSISRLSRAESEALLEPWLGQGNLSADIPLPALISAEVTPERRRNLDPLREALAEAAPRATLDDHGQWNDRLIDAARRGQSVAFIIVALVLGAAGAVIVFATRAGLAANRDIVEVMHMVGASDSFIADQVQRRYLSLGLRGGCLGAGLAAVVMFVLASIEGDSSGFFLPNLGADPTMLLWLSIVPLILCLVASLTARVTVRQVLARTMA